MWRSMAARRRKNRSIPRTSAERAAGCALCNRLSAWDSFVCREPQSPNRRRWSKTCLPQPFRNDAEVPEFGHQSFGVERQEIGHADQSITRHRPEMCKPSALNAWKIDRGEAPNDIKVRKLRTQDCLGQRPPVLHASQTRGGNLVGHPVDITDRCLVGRRWCATNGGS